MPRGRPKRYENQAEKQRAYRKRQKTLRNSRYEIGQMVSFALGTYADPKNAIGTVEAIQAEGVHVRSLGGGLHIITDIKRIGPIWQYISTR